MDSNEPKGIEFYNIKSGDTHYCRLEPTIQAYINSSDMGINASRDQDFGWRLGKEWVEKVRAFKRDETKMQVLTAKNGDNQPTTTQILYAIYGEQLRAFQALAEEYENPFEEEYLQSIRPSANPVENVGDGPADNFDEVAGDDPADPTGVASQKPKKPSSK